MHGRWRLDAKAPRVADAFRTASPGQRRLAVRVACEIVVPLADVHDEGPVAAAIQALRRQHVPPPELRRQLRRLARWLEEAASQSEEVRAPNAVSYFAKARAVSALLFASSDPSELHESLCEAVAVAEACDDPNAVLGSVLAALRMALPAPSE